MLKWLFKSEPLIQPTPHADSDLLDPRAIAEYRSLANEVGVSAVTLDSEEFRLFLSEHDLPTFNRADAVAYMDKVAARDNPMGLGWHWCPVRSVDAYPGLTFGTPSHRHEHLVTDHNGAQVSSRDDLMTVASDYYSDKIAPYARTIPLHALKKIALIETKFGKGRTRFLVTDYALAPHKITRSIETLLAPPPPRPPAINPDPFLMAVIPNPDVAYGRGTFIIDVWDEPGFGLQRFGLAPG